MRKLVRAFALAAFAVSLFACRIASPPASAPTGMTATQDSYFDRVVVVWTEVANATSYNVYRSSDGNAFVYLGRTSSTTYTDSEPLESYAYYRVSAAGQGEETEPSEIVCGYIQDYYSDGCKVSPHELLTGSTNYNDQAVMGGARCGYYKFTIPTSGYIDPLLFNLSGISPSGVDLDFYVYSSSDFGSASLITSLVDVGTASSYRLTGFSFTPGRSYYLRVKCYAPSSQRVTYYITVS